MLSVILSSAQDIVLFFLCKTKLMAPCVCVPSASAFTINNIVYLDKLNERLISTKLQQGLYLFKTYKQAEWLLNFVIF